MHAGEGWRRFLDNPGDIIIGAAPGAGCFGAAYEYLFNVSHQLRKAGLKRQVNLTYISAEPFLGHFGIGGLPHGESLLHMFFKKEHITAVLNAAIYGGGLLATEGTVEFVAHRISGGQRGEQHEVSRFVREEGAWRYLDAF